MAIDNIIINEIVESNPGAINAMTNDVVTLLNDGAFLQEINDSFDESSRKSPQELSLIQAELSDCLSTSPSETG